MTIKAVQHASATAVVDAAHGHCRYITRAPEVCASNVDWIDANALGSEGLGTGQLLLHCRVGSCNEDVLSAGGVPCQWCPVYVPEMKCHAGFR